MTSKCFIFLYGLRFITVRLVVWIDIGTQNNYSLSPVVLFRFQLVNSIAKTYVGTNAYMAVSDSFNFSLMSNNF